MFPVTHDAQDSSCSFRPHATKKCYEQTNMTTGALTEVFGSCFWQVYTV